MDFLRSVLRQETNQAVVRWCEPFPPIRVPPVISCTPLVAEPIVHSSGCAEKGAEVEIKMASSLFAMGSNVVTATALT